MTNGAPAGTSQLAVAGANSGGLFNLGYFGNGFSPGFTVLGRIALFEGYDANGRDSLWVSDGTAAGTVELPIGSANAGGLFANVAAPELTRFGGGALLVGQNIAGSVGLWITDGTAPGTHELTAAGAFANGLFFNIAAPDFTVLGGRALFQGQNAAGNVSLWVTDGTSAGTSELAVGGAHSSGVFVNVAGPDITVFGGVALFAGENAGGNVGLWVTEGTSAGTRELAAVGAFANGLFFNIAAPDLTVLGGKALFQGQDAAGNVNLWATDGTSAGTSELAVAGGSPSGLLPTGLAALPGTPASDFNADGRSDMLFQNSSGEAFVWVMSGAAIIGGGSLSNPGPDWHATAARRSSGK